MIGILSKIADSARARLLPAGRVPEKCFPLLSDENDIRSLTADGSLGNYLRGVSIRE